MPAWGAQRSGRMRRMPRFGSGDADARLGPFVSGSRRHPSRPRQISVKKHLPASARKRSSAHRTQWPTRRWNRRTAPFAVGRRFRMCPRGVHVGSARIETGSGQFFTLNLFELCRFDQSKLILNWVVEAFSSQCLVVPDVAISWLSLHQVK